MPAPLRRRSEEGKKAKKANKGAYYTTPKKAKKARSDAPRKVGGAGVRQVQPNYWKRVKRELHILICTNDKKYETLRRHIGKERRRPR
jgi:hypothetical protein